MDEKIRSNLHLSMLQEIEPVINAWYLTRCLAFKLKSAEVYRNTLNLSSPTSSSYGVQQAMSCTSLQGALEHAENVASQWYLRELAMKPGLRRRWPRSIGFRYAAMLNEWRGDE